MTRASAFETMIGLLVIAVAAVFFFYAYGVTGSGVGGQKYQLEAIFGSVDGLDVGADVKIAGVKIGTVSGNRLNPDTYEATLDLLIHDDVRVPDDSIAKIASDGLLGGVHVAIEPGASEAYFEAGDRITITRGSVDILNLAVQAFTSQGAGSSASGDDEGQTELDPLGDL